MSETKTETALARVQPTDTSLAPQTLPELMHFAKTFAEADLLPKHLRGRPADLAVTVMYGNELGLTPMQSIYGIDCIEGKPSPKAITAHALVLRSGLVKKFECLKTTNEECIYFGERSDRPDKLELSYTIQDAERAELTRKDNWRKNPKAMLRARAKMQLAKELWPDVVSNIIDPDDVDDVGGGGFTAPPPPPGATARWSDTPSAAPASSAAPPAAAIEVQATPVPKTAGPAPADAVGHWSAKIKDAPSRRQLEAVGAQLAAAGLKVETRDKLKEVYRDRMAVLEKADAAILREMTGPPPAAAPKATWGDTGRDAPPAAAVEHVQAEMVVEREVGADDGE
jgi:hypothetical protein